MNTPAAQPVVLDPAELVRQLDPDTIRERIEQIDRERERCMVLLCAALRARPPGSDRKGGPHAA